MSRREWRFGHGCLLGRVRRIWRQSRGRLSLLSFEGNSRRCGARRRVRRSVRGDAAAGASTLRAAASVQQAADGPMTVRHAAAAGMRGASPAARWIRSLREGLCNPNFLEAYGMRLPLG
ncbi:hypothetical protein X946_5193 [Burkholderia sp. ABCPW 111]|nr:hypothetical protein X946_5193 [Burkholderia sp. ABCPW 111]